MIETTASSSPLSTSFDAAVELEWHCLDKRYEYLRQRTPQLLRRMMLSICTYGLLTPITVIPALPLPQASSRWIVIDGYLRIQAMHQLGKDMIAAQHLTLSADEALMTSYRASQSRPWESLEEATLLQELITHHDYSQAQCAQKLGKSKSWVSYRLQLLAQLPEFVRQAVYQGALSGWVASRVMVPFARANAYHAQQFIEYLAQHSHSSRESQTFYEHYMQANHRIREKMIAQPELFFKAQVESGQLSQSTPKSNFSWRHLSPEQQWAQRLNRIIQELNALNPLLPKLFYPQQPLDERQDLEQRLEQAATAMNALKHDLRRIPYAQKTDGAHGSTTASGRPQLARNQPVTGHLPQ
jgi:ParB/RepB/Spo0J family partition protein